MALLFLVQHIVLAINQSTGDLLNELKRAARHNFYQSIIFFKAFFQNLYRM